MSRNELLTQALLSGHSGPYLIAHKEIQNSTESYICVISKHCRGASAVHKT